MSPRAIDPSLPVSNPTQAYWQLPLHPDLLGTRSESLPPTSDIVVLGSGITSCSAVLELLQRDPTSRITVLEAREVCSGATGRNGGRINCVAIFDYDKYLHLYGHEIAVKIVRFELAHYEAIYSAVEAFGSDLLNDSEIRQVDTVAAFYSNDKLDAVKSQLKQFEDAFTDLKGRWSICEGDELSTKYHLRTAKGALIGRAGAAWPYRIVTGIFAKLLSKHENLSMETNTLATEISRESASNQDFPYIIRTPRGDIRAKHIIHCTEGHTAHHVPGLRGILVPRLGQNTVQSPGSSFPYNDGSCSWSFYMDGGFDYAIQLRQTGEIVIGGGDFGGVDTTAGLHSSAADDKECIPAKVHLNGVLPVVFGDDNWGAEVPGKMQLKKSWVGVMCDSMDAVPMVGRIPNAALQVREEGDQNSAEWISAGYGGYGMVNAFLCGKNVARMVIGLEVQDILPDVFLITPERVEKLKAKVQQL